MIAEIHLTSKSETRDSRNSWRNWKVLVLVSRNELRIRYVPSKNNLWCIYDWQAYRIFSRCAIKIIESIPSIQYIQIDDNSDGLCDGGAKLVITVVSESFNDTSVIQRHRKIQAILKDNNLMPSIHALTLNTWTPTQYETKKSPVSIIIEIRWCVCRVDI